MISLVKLYQQGEFHKDKRASPIVNLKPPVLEARLVGHRFGDWDLYKPSGLFINLVDYGL